MSNLFHRNRRLLALTIVLILVSGLSSYAVLPRMEDPILVERVAQVHTVFPGADPERVETLVTEKLEEELQDIDEIKELRSVSRTGISVVTIELRDDVYESDPIWSRVRDKLGDATPLLPPGATAPKFEDVPMKAYAQIVALTWQQDAQPNYAILRRLSEDLEDQIRAIPGTEDVETFGDPTEEITVAIDLQQLAMLGLTTTDIARQIEASDAKVASGQFRGHGSDLLLEVNGELDSLAQIAQMPIHYAAGGQFVQLGDIAKIHKGIAEPPESLVLVDGHPAIALSVLVRESQRIDHWTQRSRATLDAFSKQLPAGIVLNTVFEQSQYVEARLSSLFNNLLLGGAAVIVVIFLLMGWRNALIVGIALPLSSLIVLTGMRMLGIPIHQMSVTGLIIALGLLIDNAIVIVDDVTSNLRAQMPPGEAVSASVKHLAIPLLGSTLTTAFAFAPIALMPGPAGEFVGSIAVSVIMAISSSFVLAMTVIPALTVIGQSLSHAQREWRWWRDGFSHAGLGTLYRRSLDLLFAHPLLGIALGLILPVAGFVQSRTLSEQFFPPADRDQFHVEMELPSHASMEQTLEMVKQVQTHLLARDSVVSADWFIGESAPAFYYNLMPKQKNASHYAQAMVQLKSAEGARELIHQLQAELDESFASSRILVRQLEQGPPFGAPVEIRIYGPDLLKLSELGEELRAHLAAVPEVIHTRSELAEALPKLSLTVDEQQARLAGLDHQAIADQLQSTLEGTTGGSIVEATEEIPVRVRVSNDTRADLSLINSLELLPSSANAAGERPRIPLSAIADVEVTAEISAIPRFNGRRMNEVQGFISAGVLPATVLGAFQQRLQEANFEMPPGYTYEFGGETEKRDDAIGNLMASVGVLLVLMVATLVLSFGSFRVAALVGMVGMLSVGLGLGALSVFGYPFGFMAIIGSMGLAGVAINDAIVVLAALREDPDARRGDPIAVRKVVTHSTRHVVATSLTTMAGFAPLVIAGGGFWPPMAIAISGGVGGATILALYFIPSAYVLAMGSGRRHKRPPSTSLEQVDSASQTPDRDDLRIPAVVDSV